MGQAVPPSIFRKEEIASLQAMAGELGRQLVAVMEQLDRLGGAR
jgi:hypothetical protein